MSHHNNTYRWVRGCNLAFLGGAALLTILGTIAGQPRAPILFALLAGWFLRATIEQW